jgi:hypothetical protein
MNQIDRLAEYIYNLQLALEDGDFSEDTDDRSICKCELKIAMTEYKDLVCSALTSLSRHIPDDATIVIGQKDFACHYKTGKIESVTPKDILGFIIKDL